MRTMVGSPVVGVHGLAATFNAALSGPQHDTLLLNLKFGNGMIGQVTLGYGAVDHGARHPKVYGREGTLTLFDDHIELWGTSREQPTATIEMEPSGNGFREEWLDFYNAITTGSPLQFPAEEALADLQIILAGLESAATGTVVRLD